MISIQPFHWKKIANRLQFKKNSGLLAFLCGFSLIIGYFYFAHYIERQDLWALLLLYIGLFTSSYLLVIQRKVSFWYLAGIALLVQLSFLNSTPALSQDIYRYIWDGRLQNQGLNPYLNTPLDVISVHGENIFPESPLLLEKMGSLSAHHFSNYPPLSQFTYATATFLGGGSILLTIFYLRCLSILSLWGTLWIGKRLLHNLGYDPKRMFIFILNPLVVIECIGNLHLESVMIFFLIGSLFLLSHKKWIGAAILMGCSISIKLLPLMLLPLFFNHFKKHFNKHWLKVTGFYTIIAVTNLILFWPYISGKSIADFLESVGLWFHNFEFNASLYYIARFIGQLWTGYNPIAVVGPLLALLSLTVILGIAFFKQQTKSLPFAGMLLIFMVYLFCSTTVHPWYLATPLLFSIFTRYKFLLLWSLTVILSYVAYSFSGVKELSWILYLEYLPVYILAILEIFSYPIKKPSLNFSKDGFVN